MKKSNLKKYIVRHNFLWYDIKNGFINNYIYEQTDDPWNNTFNNMLRKLELHFRIDFSNPIGKNLLDNLRINLWDGFRFYIWDNLRDYEIHKY